MKQPKEVVTNKYQMQDISNMSHRDMKPMVAPSPSLVDTHFNVAVDRMLSKPIDTTNNDTPRKRGDSHTGLHMLRFIINEPGPKLVYHHIMREILDITPGGTLDKLIVARLRGRQDAISLKYSIMDLDCNDNVNYDWIYSLEEDGIIDEDQLDELLIIESYHLSQLHAEQDGTHIRWIYRYHQMHT